MTMYYADYIDCDQCPAKRSVKRRYHEGALDTPPGAVDFTYSQCNVCRKTPKPKVKKVEEDE